jgi:hypothetical protein
MDWLHFVGKTYYTPEQYIEEALRIGASRKTNARVIRQMTWGDRVFLAQGDMRKKNRTSPFNGSTIFGFFTILTLGGLPQEVLEEIAEAQGLEITDAPIQASAYTRRRCGHYSLGPSVKGVKIPLGDIPDYIDEDDRGSYLLQGKFTPLEVRPTLSDIGFRWGFRRFDGSAYLRAIENGQDTIEGELLISKDAIPPKSLGLSKGGTLRSIVNYTQISVYGPKSRFDY